MKTIYLKVEVPDDLKLHIFGIDTKVPANHFPLQFKEIPIPTEDEIGEEAKQCDRNQNEQIDFRIGAKWILNKIMEEK